MKLKIKINSYYNKNMNQWHLKMPLNAMSQKVKFVVVTVKRAWWGAILGWVTSWEVFQVRTSEAKVRWKDLCWSVGLVYSLHE